MPGAPLPRQQGLGGFLLSRRAAVVFFTAVNIRKFVLRAATLHDIVELGSLPAAAARFFDASVRAGLNILVAGGTQAGNPTIRKHTPRPHRADGHPRKAVVAQTACCHHGRRDC
jgi:hypothetical protein